MSRGERIGTARAEGTRLPVSATLGSGQLQQWGRNEPPCHCGCLCDAQHAAWYDVQCTSANDEQAYDVAGYIVSQDRPKKANLDEDFPIRLQKPIDTPYGPYADGFPAEQHLLGPFGPIRAKVKELAAESRTAHAGEPDNGSLEGADR